MDHGPARLMSSLDEALALFQERAHGGKGAFANINQSPIILNKICN
jgi:hypothetical protein